MLMCINMLVHRLTLTTRPRTNVRTFSPISGEMSLPNCCSVIRKRLSLLSCRAPHANGSCKLPDADDEDEEGEDEEEDEEEEGRVVKPPSGEGTPFDVVGEWPLPSVTVENRKRAT